jgi:Xaa-Pro aminopeptidase
MKADLDRLMTEHTLDAIIVLGDENPNPFLDYLTNRAKAHGVLFKKRGETPVFIVGGMEIDEARKSGLDVRTYYEFGFADLYQKFGANPDAFRRELFLAYVRQLDIRGRVAVYGVVEIGPAMARLLALQDSALGIDLVFDGPALNLFGKMYETKDAQELAALREAGQATAEVVRRTWDYLSRLYATGEATGSPVVDEDGRPVTIGDVKRFIRAQQIALGLNDEECIFAQGRDAGIPHSHGEDDQALQTGRSIVFDIFPKGVNSGYYHDMTRTWCLGHAPADVQALYDDVMYIFHEIMGSLRVGEPNAKYQIMTLDYFESKGHPTGRSHPGTMDGYVHSLGHGIGMNVHESPSFRERSTEVLQPGNCFTVEPGLYYPERGYGVRVEDSVYFDESGQLHNLTNFPYDLVIPLRLKA